MGYVALLYFLNITADYLQTEFASYFLGAWSGTESLEEGTGRRCGRADVASRDGSIGALAIIRIPAAGNVR